MTSKLVAAVLVLMFNIVSVSSVGAAPTEFRVSIPLDFGGHGAHEPAHIPTATDVRAERRLRLTRYALQLADAIISAIGYHAYAQCLSCLAYPGGGPRGSAPLSIADVSGNRPAEINPLVQPFSRGGIGSLAIGALAFDFIDARVEKHWSVERRASADVAEIGAHVWGISTWVPEIRTIHQDVATASACGAQWQAKHYGEAFSAGCVNEYYRAGPLGSAPFPNPQVFMVCAPARFKHGAYLFTTRTDYVIASGTPCTDTSSPFP